MKAVVFTTIGAPTKALKEWAKIKGWWLIGVGDEKTPTGWRLKNCSFNHARHQKSKLAEILPWNHYSRKMLGYAQAISLGAEVIVDTDDDNIPTEDWGIPCFDGRFEVTLPVPEFVNIYRYFTDTFVWPRGFPLDRIEESRHQRNRLQPKWVKVGVWQGLADADPDVDAIFRMTRGHPVIFEMRDPVVLEKGAVCPFNSQNTAFRKELFPLLYLPTTVSFRFTDILRGLVAQPIMWKAGYHLGFTGPTVVQERNEHRLMDDFKSEIEVYLHASEIHTMVNERVRCNKSVTDNLYIAYSTLLGEGVVPDQEMRTLVAWLNELEKA